MVVMSLLQGGDFFGETALISEDKRSANAKALTVTHIIAFFRSDLLEIIRRNPSFGTKILFNLSNKSFDFFSVCRKNL